MRLCTQLDISYSSEKLFEISRSQVCLLWLLATVKHSSTRSADFPLQISQWNFGLNLHICDITAQTELVEWKETFFYCIVNVMLPYHRYVIESYTFTLIRKLMWERIERVVGVIVSETVNSCRVLPELAGNWMISLATSTHSRLRFYLETLSLKQNRVSRSKLTIEKIMSRLLQK